MEPEPEELALASSSMEISLTHKSWLRGGFDSHGDRDFTKMQDNGDWSEGEEARRRTNRSDVRLTKLILKFT